MSKDFDLLSAKSRFTDDTVMTIAVADALSSCGGNKDTFIDILPKRMRMWGRRYPNAGYGGKFKQWIKSDDVEAYNSFGNGSAMRVSPCGLAALSLNEALELAKISAEVTYNHPEGIKGAQAVVSCIYLAKSGSKIDEIKKYMEDNFYSHND